VAYGYCKILKEAGYPVELRCHDIKHLMSQPEWDDLDLDPSDFPDEDDFYKNTADFGQYSRPSWYLSDDLWPPQESSTVEKHATNFFRRHLPSKIKHRLFPFYYAINKLLSRDSQRNNCDKNFNYFINRCQQIAMESEKLGNYFKLTQNNLKVYLPHTNWLERHINKSDVIFSYVLSPIYAMIYGKLPYISVEIGTMRDLPLDGSLMNKTLWLSYKYSDHVIITNPDNNKLAEEQGITNYTFCPHPLDEDICKPINSNNENLFQKEIREKYNSDMILFAPARQNWKIKGNDKYLKAFSLFLKSNKNASLLIPGWGQEVERSKNLCNELNISNRVFWLAPMSERMLTRYYQSVDIVLDQFQLGVFGLITPKAMSCEKPVLTSYNRYHHKWCFPEDPPVVAAQTEKEIFQALINFSSRSKRNEVGKRSRDWILKYHSKNVIKNKLLESVKLAKYHFMSKVKSQ
jgi:glycosyltransferase involved in cell wall biosynthesis